jgi:subtilisin family serine protease
MSGGNAWRSAVILAALALAVSLAPEAPRPASTSDLPPSRLPVVRAITAPSPRPANAAQDGYAAGTLLLKPRPGLTDSDITRFAKLHGASVKRRIPAIGWYVLALGKGQNPKKAETIFSRIAEPGSAQRDPVVHEAVVPNDPLCDSTKMWGLYKIHASQAWDVQEGTAAVTVAVTDTGLDMAHVDIQAKVWSNPGETGLDSQGRDKRTNGVDDDHDGYVDDWRGWNFVTNSNDPTDDQGHGTHVSGTIAAGTDNGLGIAGVSWNSPVMPVKFLDSTGGGYASNGAAAIVYAADHGAKVINCSWVGGWSSAVEDACTYAYNHGAVVAAAAGNSGVKSMGLAPANCTNVITVAATDQNDARATFSNYGPAVEVAAPGVSILSLYAGGGYAYMSGTSMATPHVSGLAALLFAQYPGWSPRAVMDRIIRTADPTGDSSIGAGRINAYRALTDTPAPPAPTGLAAVSGDGLVDLSWNANNGPDIAGYNVYEDGSKITTSPVAGTSRRVSGLANGRTYAFQITAVDSAGGESTRCATVTATPQETRPPAAPAWLTAVDTPSDAGGSIDLEWAASADTAAVTSYRVFRGTSTGSYGTPLSVGNVLRYTDTSCTTGVTYFYRVAAVDAASRVGSMSPEASAAALSNPPVTPSVISSSNPDPARPYSVTNVSLSWTCAGAATYSYVIDHAATTTPDASAEGTSTRTSYSGLADGEWYFHVRGANAAGLWGATAHYRLRIDTTPPSGSFAVNRGEISCLTRDISLDSAITDAAEMRFDTGDGYGSWMPYAGSTIGTLSAGNGTKAVYAQYRDAAGNILTLSDSIYLNLVTRTENAYCLACHARSGPHHDDSFVLDSGTVTFTVAPVDYATACSKCHWAGSPAAPGTSMPYQTTSHNYSSGTACSGTGCHSASYGGINGVAVPHSLVASMGSYFYSAASVNVDSATLHRIHANPRWPALNDIRAGGAIPGQVATKKALYTLHCGSCHASAACDACHQPAAMSPSHSAHTTATALVTVGRGTPSGDQSVVSTTSAAVSCLGAGCHLAAAVGAPAIFDSAGSGVVKSGSWTLLSGGVFYGGSAVKADTTTATVSIVASGSEFALYGFTLPAGGSGRLTVDGSVVATIGFYSATQSGCTDLFRGSLAPGTHTITLTSTGIAGKGAGKYVTFDYLAAWGTPFSSFVPYCETCHADRLVGHDYSYQGHSVAGGEATDTALGLPCTAAGCHTMDLMADHSSHVRHGQPTGCAVCHSTQPGDSMAAADWVGSTGAWDVSRTCDLCHGNPAAAALVPSLVTRPAHYRLGHDLYKPITSIVYDAAWSRSPAVFSLTATDEAFGSGVASTHYTLDGGADNAYAAPVSVSKEGTTQVGYWSVDASGNIETTNAANVLVDDHAPSIVGTTTTPANAAGWYRANVTVHFTAADELSGVSAVSPDVTLQGPGADLSASGSATDAAGNRAAVTVGGIKIDKASPVTVDDARASYDGTAAVHLTPADDLSGVAHTYYSFDGGATSQDGTLVVSTVPGAYDLTYWSVDAAGNAEPAHHASYMLWPASAAYTKNRQCLSCHARSGSGYGVSPASTETFTASPVDFATACYRCHWIGDPTSPTSSMPYATSSHSYSNVSCSGSGCHLAPFGALNGMAVPHSFVASMGSWFYSASSYGADSATLHRIHANPRWPASADITAGGAIPGQPSRRGLYDLRCPSCHASAACSACHGPVEHSTHSTATATGRFAGGEPGEVGILSVTTTMSCIGAGCHPVSAVSSGTPYDSAGSVVTKTGAWATVTAVSYLGGSAIKSNSDPSGISAQVRNVASGTEFSYFGFQFSSGGYAWIYVDGSRVATVSCYAQGQSGGVELFRGSLPAGDHTLEVRNAQIPGRVGGSTYVTFDGFVVYLPYQRPDGPFRSFCGSVGCHLDKTVDHIAGAL